MPVTKRNESEVKVTGEVKRGRLRVKRKLRIPDGRVEVTIRNHAQQRKTGLSRDELLAHPSFGMWKDFLKAEDTAAFVRNLRSREDSRSRHAR